MHPRRERNEQLLQATAVSIARADRRYTVVRDIAYRCEELLTQDDLQSVLYICCFVPHVARESTADIAHECAAGNSSGRSCTILIGASVRVCKRHRRQMEVLVIPMSTPLNSSHEASTRSIRWRSLWNSIVVVVRTVTFSFLFLFFAFLFSHH